MFTRFAPTLGLIVAVSTMVGCLGPRHASYDSSAPIAIAERSEEGDRLWEAAQETLRRHRFLLDRVDRREGVITTMPVGSQHFFEFWRHDVDSWPDFWEATLNPLRRWVEVKMTRGPDEGWSELSVVVHKERLSSPDRQFNRTGAAYQYFGDNLPSTEGLVRVTPEQDVWLDLGRDPAMEEHLLQKIMEYAGVDIAPGSPAGSDPEPTP